MFEACDVLVLEKLTLLSETDQQRAAENAFWTALEERRDDIRAARVPFDERSHSKFRELHSEHRLLSGLVAGVSRYKRGRGDPNRLKAMALVMKAGLPTWEHLLLRPAEPWTPFVTKQAERGARAAIADAEELVRWV